MRVVVLCLSPSRGGLELYALEEIRQLIKRGHECFAVVSPNSYLSETLEKENIPFSTLSLSFKRLPIIAAKQLKDILTRFNATTLHFHWGNDLYLAALAKSMFKQKLSLVHTRHMNLTRNKKDIIHKWFYEKIDLLLAGTKLLQNDARKYLVLPAEKIKLLYIGVREPIKENTNCEQFFNQTSFERRKLNLAIFGRIEEGKGQHLLTEAMQRMIADGKDISLTLIGHTMDANYKEELTQEIQSINKYIQFKEFVSDAADCMSCFDVIVLSTHCETFGLVLVEAMRSGVAVVGTNAGGVPEIITDGVSGLLVEPRNSKSMQAAIEKLYTDDSLLKALAEKGKQVADTVFSDTLHYEHLEQELKTALSI